MTKEYKLIPMNQITEEARKIAVAWIENYQPTGGFDLPNKHKLASDIQNFGLNLLNDYSIFLEEEGYTDHDWRTEEPFSIDKFMKRKRNEAN
jgi:hypothetical protein